MYCLSPIRNQRQIIEKLNVSIYFGNNQAAKIFVLILGLHQIYQIFSTDQCAIAKNSMFISKGNGENSIYEQISKCNDWRQECMKLATKEQLFMPKVSK